MAGTFNEAGRDATHCLTCEYACCCKAHTGRCRHCLLLDRMAEVRSDNSHLWTAPIAAAAAPARVAGPYDLPFE